MNTNSIVSDLYSRNNISNNNSAYKTSKQAETAKVTTDARVKASGNLGQTIGEPQLSKEAQKYYENLKKKFGNYDFILVSEDQKANAQANAAKYANGLKTVVLIDEAKIERMATDADYRKKYEGILSGAATQLDQLKASMKNSGADVQGYGMQVNDGGTASFFAVLKKSSNAQKARIEKAAANKKAEKKAAERKAEKKQAEARLEKTREKHADKPIRKNTETDFDSDDTVTIIANSIEELMQKINDYTFNEKSDAVQTESEKMVGQNFDFRA